MPKISILPSERLKRVLGREHSFFQSGRTSCLVLAVFVLVCAGCKKPATTAASTPENVNNQSQTDQAPAPARARVPTVATAQTTAAPLVTPTGDPDLGAINRALLRWVMGNRRTPQNFDDFAATAGVTIPPPPAGKKYVIAKNMHILLVDQ
jgi:hypothetical protein